IKDKRFPELCLLPAAQTRDKNALSTADMAAICSQLREEFDFVLVDSPAGIEQGFRNAIAGADEVVVVTTPEVSAVRDADRVIGLAEAAGKGEPRLIINRIKPAMVRRGDMLDTSDVIDILAVELIGIVPDDEAIIVSTNRGESAVLDRKSGAGQAFLNVARRLMGDEVPFINLDDGRGLMQRLGRLVGLGSGKGSGDRGDNNGRRWRR
ncbi:MAG: septum site-determining protein MinD, partial [Chloroflexi bacterium]|nr:septum site-determining protein MinD [Chloroflexota bacterium]